MSEKRLDTYLVTRSIGLRKPLPHGRILAKGDTLSIIPLDRAADKHGLLTAWLAYHVGVGNLEWQPENSGPLSPAPPVPSRTAAGPTSGLPLATEKVLEAAIEHVVKRVFGRSRGDFPFAGRGEARR